MRRFGMAVFGSAMLAAIIFAGAGVYGFLFPSGANLEDPSIIIERETGARFVYVDGELHPVLNFTSARLFLGSDNPTVKSVSLQSLRAYRRGPAMGIANAPDPLPERSALMEGPWSACSLRRSLGSQEFVTHLVIGNVRPGGEPLGESGLLILRRTSGSISRWLIWHGHRYRVGTAELAALGLAAVQPVEVTNALIDAIPPGPDLAIPPIERVGQQGPAVAGEPGLIGQVYLAAGQRYVLLDSGLATIGPVMANLFLASGNRIIEVSANAASAAQSATVQNFDPSGFPSRMPDVILRDTDPAMLCAVAGASPSSPDQSTTITVYSRLDAQVSSIQPGQARTGPDGVRVADHVEIPSGRATLVRVLPAPGDQTGNTTTYLVTDRHVKYALPRLNTAEVLASLGYGGIEPMPVPVYMLALLPLGPTLDPMAAGRFVIEEAPEAPRTTPTQS